MQKTTREKAEQAVAEMRYSGFTHQTLDEERASSLLFTLEREEFEKVLDSSDADFVYHRYIDVLAPDPVRAYKNSLICLITNVCRIAVSFGLEVEYSYSLSDFYINELEKKYDLDTLIEFTKEMLLHYYDLVRKSKKNIYAPPVAKAIRFIARNLYSPMTVEQIARFVGKEKHYFSELFKRETGMTPSKYVMKEKLEEAKKQLQITNKSISEIAESLGFYDVSHFSRNFKKAYGENPSAYK